jgi:PAP2 superfamily
MWLPWPYAAVGAVALGLAARFVPAVRRRTGWHALARETAIVAALYALWIRAEEFDPFGTAGGLDRGRAVWRLEGRLGLLHETTVQSWVLGHRRVVQASNIYYGGLHVTVMGILLVWLFARHRALFGVWRTTLALTTGVCLLIRYVPVAPPRFYPEYGFIDTANLYNQSVYGPVGTGVSGQFGAMPSIHVAWAVLVGVAAWRVSTSRWRWLGLAHAAITVFVVTCTANHWLLDGIVGAALLVPAYVGAAWWTRTRRERPPGSEIASPVGLPSEATGADRSLRRAATSDIATIA